jgi:hypothetical protein
VISGTFNDRQGAEAELPELSSRVAGLPGFVAGYWIGLQDQEALAVIAFDSEEAAQALAQGVHGGPVDVIAIKVGEVIGNA